jgi:phosphoribosylamine--glycine ligase
MRILVVGNGGREHALLWKLRRDHPSGEFFVTRPNGGMVGACTPVEIAPTDKEALSGWAAANRMDLVVVGPEAPLAMGLADRLRQKGVPVFGPSRDAARIESSKAWAKELMTAVGVPTAAYRAFTDPDAAEAYIRQQGAPIVVKASGLAAGKGAVVCREVEEAVTVARAMLHDLSFGEAGREVVVEEFMAGEELSVFGVTDGSEVILLVPSQDHKRIGEGDTGPNTGGMGAYAPVSLATPELLDRIRAHIFAPVLREMRERECPFQGLLYAGLMLTTGGPKVVEFNCRFGDPESQVVLPLLESSLLELLVAAAEGRGLAQLTPRFRDGAAVTTVIASEGYPGSGPRGVSIDLSALDPGDDLVVFHAGTAHRGDALVTAGGRVLACTGLGPTLADAAERSRAAAASVRFDGAQHRRDIGWRELERTRAAD